MTTTSAVNQLVSSFLRDKLGDVAQQVINYLEERTFCLNGQIAIGSIFVLAQERGVLLGTVFPQIDREYLSNWQYQHPEIRGSTDAPGMVGMQNRKSLENIYFALGIPSPVKR